MPDRNPPSLSPDQVCSEFSKGSSKVSIRSLDEDMVLIEGDTETLLFLGNLFIAQAKFQKDCGFQISPSGAGSSLFASNATKGLYIHRIPCENHDPQPPSA